MKRQNGMLKKSVAFALALVMSLGQAPTTLLASEEAVDTSLVPQEESSEIEVQSEEGSTEGVDSGVSASLETEGGTIPEETNVESVEEESTEEGSGEDSSAAVTEVPTEQTEGDFTDGSEIGTPDDNTNTGDDTTVVDVAEATPTPEPTQAIEEVVQFDYEGTYNALKSSWNSDRDTSRDSMLRNLVNKTGLVKYKYGAGHSATYFAEKGISDVADALYITENPEYLDDTGLIAWALWFNGRKEASYWVADTGMKGIDESDYFQSVNYDQLLPGDIACSEDGVWAIYGGKLDGYDVWIGSYHTDENLELGVCCDNVYRKDFKYFYRFTWFTDALKDENEGADVPEATPTDAPVEKVEPTEVPKEENKEEVEPTEAPKEDIEKDENKGELSGVLSAETLDPEGNAVNVSFTGDELQDDYIGNASLSSDDADKELYDSLAEYVGSEFDTVLPLMLDVTDESGNEVSEVGTVKVDIDSSIDFTNTVLYHYENEEWVRVDYEVVDGGVEFVTGGFSPFFFIKETNNSDDANAEDTTTGDDTNKDDTPDVNNGLIVNMVNEGTDSVKTGDTHKIALKTSYANPNDEDTANVKVYMWDGSKLDENVPAEGIIIKNLVDNKLIYQVENNKDLSVEVEYKTDKDENGKVTASYLEFNLNPGTSLDMELEFTVKNGYYDEKSLRFSIDLSRSSGEVADNDFSYVCNPIKWTGEFGWSNLVKNSNIDNIGFNADSKFNKDINYTFSAVHSSFGSKGSIFTKSIDIVDTITIPSSVDLTGLVVEKDAENKPTGKILDGDGNTVFEFVGLNEVTEVTIDGCDVTYKGTVLAEEDTDIRNLSGLKLNAYMTKLGVDSEYISSGREVIVNNVNMVFNPVVKSVGSINLDANKDIKFDREYTGIDVEKISNVKKASKGDEVSYTVKITNKDKRNKTFDFRDVLSDELYFSKTEKESLEKDGYTVGHVDTLYKSSDTLTSSIENGKSIFNINVSATSSKPLHSGGYFQGDLLLPGGFDGLADLNFTIKSSDGNEFTDLITIRTDNSTIIGNNVSVSFGSECDLSSLSDIESISIDVSNFSKTISGDVFLQNIVLYDGLYEIGDTDSADNCIDINNFGLIKKNKEDVSLDSTLAENVEFRNKQEKYWCTDMYAVESNLGIDYKTETIPKLTTDIYFSADDKGYFYKSSREALGANNSSPGIYFGSMILYVKMMVGDSWEWKEAQLPFTYSALLDCDNSEMSSSKKVTKKVRATVELPEDLINYEKLQWLSIELVGSDSAFCGNIEIKNTKVDFGDKVGLRNNCVVKKGINLAPKASVVVRYNATVCKSTEGKAKNSCIATVNGVGVKGGCTIDIKDEQGYNGNVSEELVLHKQYYNSGLGGVVTKYNPAIQDGYTLSFLLTLENNSPFTKEVTIQDYSPFAGNYIIEKDGYRNTWCRYKDYNNTPDLSTFGYLSLWSGDMKTNMISGSDVSDSDGLLEFTVSIPPYTTYENIVLLNCPNNSTKRYRTIKTGTSSWNTQSYSGYLTDWDYFMNIASNAMWGGYGTVYSEVSGRLNHLNLPEYENYYPHNTALIKGTFIGESVKTIIPYETEIQMATIGAGVYPQDSNTRDGILNRLSANYSTQNTYMVDDDLYGVVVEAITVSNISARGIDLSKAKLSVNIPDGYRFVGYTTPSTSTDHYSGLGGQRLTDVLGTCQYDSSNSSLWENIYSLGYDKFGTGRNILNLIGSGFTSFTLTGTSDRTNYYNRSDHLDGYNYSQTQSDGGTVQLNFSENSYGDVYCMPGMSNFTVYVVLQRTKNNQAYTNNKSCYIRASFDISGCNDITNGLNPFAINYDTKDKDGDGGVVHTRNNSFGSESPLYELKLAKTPVSSGCYTRQYEASATSVWTSLSIVPQYKDVVNIQKLVVARNSYKDLMSGKGTLNCYEEDMRKIQSSENETVTFLVSVAVDNNTDRTRVYNIIDTLPAGLELLGIQTLSDDIVEQSKDSDLFEYRNTYGTTSYPTHLGLSKKIISRTYAKSGVGKYGFENILNKPEKYKVGYTYSAVIGDQKKDYDGNPTMDFTPFYTGSRDYFTEMYKNSGTYLVSGMPSTYTKKSNLNFMVTLNDANSVAYILYTCRVHPEYLGNATSIENSATISTNYYRSEYMKNFMGMDTMPFYSGMAINSGRIVNIEQQNRGSGSEGLSMKNNDSSTLGNPEALSFTAKVKIDIVNPNISANINKTVVGALDIDNQNKEGAYYSDKNGDTIGWNSSDSKPLCTMKYIGDFGEDYGIGIDGNAKVLPYSVVDGIHSTNAYRGTVLWRVDVTNDGEADINNLMGNNLTEVINDPFVLNSYVLLGYDEKKNLQVVLSGKDLNKSDQDVKYQSIVDGSDIIRNKYTLDFSNATYLGGELSKDKYMDYFNSFKRGYNYHIFFFTNMNEEKMGYFYDTTELNLGTGVSLKSLDSNSRTENNNTIVYDSDWVSVIASDGIKSIEKGTSREETSKENTTYIMSDEDNGRLDFTLEMISYLYETDNFVGGSLNNITFYDLLPGINGGLSVEDAGGGYSVDPNSFTAYVLRTDGSKELLDNSKFSVSYSDDALHGGRHHSPYTDSVNDTVYNVDFEKAESADWYSGYLDKARSMRIVFDNSVHLNNADRLYFKYSVDVRGTANPLTEYHNIFGYSYGCDSADGSIHKDLVADTSDVTVQLEKNNDLYITKDIKSVIGEIPPLSALNSTSFDFLLKDDEKTILEFSVKGLETVNISKLLKKKGLYLKEGDKYYIEEKFSNSNNNVYEFESFEVKDINSKDIIDTSNSNIISFTYSKDTGLLFTCSNNYTGAEVRVVKVDEEGNRVFFSEKGGKYSTLTYKLYDEEGNVVPLYSYNSNDERAVVYSYYNFKNSTIGYNSISIRSSILHIIGLPLGKKFTLKEVSAPNYYEKSEKNIDFTMSEDNLYKEIKVVNKLNTDIKDLSIKKTDEEGNVIEDYSTIFVTSYLGDDNYYYGANYEFVDSDDAHGNIYRFLGNDSSNSTRYLKTYKGKITIIGLPKNDLKIFEAKAPYGYALDSRDIIIGSSETEFTFKDKKKSKDFYLFKTDSDTGKLVGGAEFSAYFGKYEGVYNENLKLYFKNDVEYEQYEYKDGNTYTIPVYTCVGASQDITNLNKNTLTDIIRSDVGIAKIKNFPSYTVYEETYSSINKNNISGLNSFNYIIFKEKKYPSGYLTDGGSWYRYIENISSDSKSISNTPKYKVVEFSKLDEEGNKDVGEGAVFNVYFGGRNNDNYLAKFKKDGDYYEYLGRGNDVDGISDLVTNKDGKILIKIDREGSYKNGYAYFVEKTPANGFLMPTPSTNYVSYYLSIDSSGIAEINMKNGHDNGKLILKKVDDHDYGIYSDTASFKLLTENDEVLKFTKNGTFYRYDKTGDVEEVSGKCEITILDIPVGNYKVVETKSPSGYIMSDTSTNIKIESKHYHKPLETRIKNDHDNGNAFITKKDYTGNTINSNKVVFKIYRADDNELVKFDYDKDGSAEYNYRKYYYNPDGYYSNIVTKSGQVYLGSLPVGDYYIKEVAAPDGYTLFEDKVPFKVVSENYYTPVFVNVKDPDYHFGDEEYVSTSYKKIEELDNPDNYGYGYYGKQSDYEAGNKNYIFVDDKSDTVKYTLNVVNMSQKSFENLVMIDKLPEVGDTGVVNQSKLRGSEFAVRMASDAQIVLTQVDKEGNESVIPSDSYKIEYSNETHFSENDWDGKDTGKWVSDLANVKSFRVVFSDVFVLPSGYKVNMTFNGTLQDDAKPGLIAWNSFGYRYYVGNNKLTPEPPKVGVKIPTQPVIKKEVSEGSTGGTFKFKVFEKAADGTLTEVKEFDLESGKEAKLEPVRTINGVTSGYLESGKTYVVAEEGTKRYASLEVVGEKGTPVIVEDTAMDEHGFEFTYDRDVTPIATFTNYERNLGKVKVNKTDVDTGDALKGVEFGIYGNDDKKLPVIKDSDGVYHIDEDAYKHGAEGTENIITNDKGTVEVSGLHYGSYYIKEEVPDDVYILDTSKYSFDVNDDSFTMENRVVTPVEKVFNVTNKKKTSSVKLTKYGTDGKTPLSDVTFKLESKDGKVSEELTTGTDGVVTFEGILPGDYTITETKTQPGMSLLADKIEVTLPLTATKDEIEEKGMDITKGYYSKSEDIYYFFNLEYNITNSALLVVPITGGSGKYLEYLLMIGTVLVILGIGWFGKKKKVVKK